METSNFAVPFSDRFAPTSLRAKILLVFVLVLVTPLSLLMLLSLQRTDEAARQDFNKRLGSAATLFRDSLEDQLDSLRVRAKTVADFDLYNVAHTGFAASATTPVLQYELIRSGLDYIAMVRNRGTPFIEEGVPPSESLEKIIPALCHVPLSYNLYILGREPWIFAAAEITKLRQSEPVHVVFAYRLARDFGDRLKRLTGAEFSLLYDNRRVLTTLMDIYGKRMTNTAPELIDRRTGVMDVMGAQHTFVREVALRSKISEAILLEISLPASEFAQLGSRMRRDFGIFGLLGLLAAFITGTYLALHMAGPINQLAESTTKVAAGDLYIKVSSGRNDEIGLLHRNFQAMIDAIREERDQRLSRMRELNTLFEISNAVNFITDSEELLKFVLTHAIEVLEAERGSIMLLDDTTDELVVKVASGGRFRIVSGTPVKLGHGICGIVAKDGKGRISNDGFRDPEFRNFGSLLPVEDIRSLLCSPLKFKDGTIGVINIVNKRSGHPFESNDLNLLNLIASQAAVTIENNKLYELSITDGLTRLFVFRYFSARLSEEVLRARRYGLKLSLIMIDIDNFKRFNDVYGHQVGDQVLQRVALAIRETIRTGIDIPCRYGGEEMAIILPETRTDEAHRTAERLRESIAALTISNPLGELRITCSLGVAAYPGDAHDKDSLVEAADKAMYYSKRNGKNRTTQASVMAEEA
ncbi:MAG TPA: diguanylate cyclase [Candidatus Ozemobacteraceae bacterium]|nr:diguanylate cyclase [Candidatus Ozemobacteraceae bacterium]